MSEEPRRSSRANKGTHSRRDLLDVYYKYDEEPEQKKRKKDADFVPGLAAQSKIDAPSLTLDRDLEGEVRCDPCGTTQDNYDEETDEGGIMIECDDCGTWQHAACMGYQTKRAIPKQYLCNRCHESVKMEANAAETVKASQAAQADQAAQSPQNVVRELSPDKKMVPDKKVVPVNKTRLSVTKALTNVLSKTHSAQVDGEQAEHWAQEMEKAIHAWSGTTNKKYIDKSRSVMALVKKAPVFQRVVSGVLSVEDLALLPPEEIDSELKDYAEKVRQELIRRSVLTVEDELSQRIRRTHKGEEIVETTSNDVEMNVNIAGRNIDHRVFRETTPTRENVIGLLSGPNLYQIADDDDDERDQANNEKEAHKDNTEANPTDGNISAAHDDSDEELDFILGSRSPENKKISPRGSPVRSQAKSAPKLPPTMSSRFWSGDIVFPDFVQFGARAEFVRCTNYEKPKDVTTASFHNRAIRVCKELLEKPRYSIEGRLDRKRADPYVEKITTSRDLYVVKVESTEGQKDYEKLFDYLYSRSKVGVLSGRAACVKDAYLYALDNDVPVFLNLGPITRGLYAVFVVKKDYVPVGKSILKKSLPPQQQATPASNLDSILSKLAASLTASIGGEFHLPKPMAPPVVPQVAQQQLPSIPLELTPDQLQYLSELVNQNPHVQQNPQALISLLQNNQMPGYH